MLTYVISTRLPKRPKLHDGHITTTQGDSGGIWNTLGNDSMCDSKQKSLYEHGSDFERMVSIFFLPYLGNRSKSDPCSYELFLLRITDTIISQSTADFS